MVFGKACGAKEGVGATIGFAAGALLVFVTVDLIPKAYSEIKWHIGLSTTHLGYSSAGNFPFPGVVCTIQANSNPALSYEFLKKTVMIYPLLVGSGS